MNIHEYQGKQILSKYGITLLGGKVAETPDEAVRGAEEIAAAHKNSVWVVKAQIHAGGRGKGGGVKLAKSIAEVRAYAGQILGMTLVTPQTGPKGRLVRKVYIEAGCQIVKELYAAFLVDRASGRVVLMSSSEGGMDIEEVAAHNPQALFQYFIDPAVGLTDFQIRSLFFDLQLPLEAMRSTLGIFKKLYTAFVEQDMAMLEINPLVLTAGNELIPLDVKISFDDNAAFRHEDLQKYRDLYEEDPAEIEASKFDLSFIKLEGNIGCLVNGAGLAMATLDIIQLYGAMPANFLDVGGGATREKVTAAFKIILKDPNVKAILVNIFGGIMKCDIIAEGVIAASKEVGLKVPLVVRLEGTNVELGKKILLESGFAITLADDLGDAAKKVAQLVK
jgi:succinyl-CoA synthetase beta subunit